MISIIYFFTSLIVTLIIVPIFSVLNINTYTKKDILYFFINLIKKWFNFTIYKISSSNIIHKPNIIYLSNHTSFSDIIIDYSATNYNSKFISRNLVAIVFPTIWFIGKLTNSILFFNRGNGHNTSNGNKIRNMTKFFSWIDYQRTRDKFNNILVYPEGTRRPNAISPCPLKKGFIYYSYDYSLPIQIIFSRNKESIFNEKIFEANRNGSIFVYYSSEIDPKYFKTLNIDRTQYYNYVQAQWNMIWNKVNSNKIISKYLSDPIKYKHLTNKFTKLDDVIYTNSNNLSLWFIFIRFGFWILIILYLLKTFI